MKLKTLVLLSCFIFANNAIASFYDEHKKFFPKDLIKLIENPEGFKAKPDKIRNNNLYFERDKHKYALELRKENNKVKRIHYTCTKSSECKSIDQFKNNFPIELFSCQMIRAPNILDAMWN